MAIIYNNNHNIQIIAQAPKKKLIENRMEDNLVLTDYALKLLSLAKEKDITDKKELAILLSQCHYETMNFKRFDENLNYSLATIMKLRTELTEAQAKMFVNNPADWGNYYYSDKQNDKRNFGNGYWPNSQGYEFRGRGCAQITGKNNYLSYYEYRKSDGYRGSFEVLVNAVSNPNSDECYLSAIWFYVKIIKRPIEPSLATAKWVGNTNTAKERTMLYNQYLSVL